MCYDLTQAKQAGTRFTYPGGMEGWVDLDAGYITRWFTCLETVTCPSSNHLIATWLGVERRTLRSQLCFSTLTPPNHSLVVVVVVVSCSHLCKKLSLELRRVWRLTHRRWLVMVSRTASCSCSGSCSCSCSSSCSSNVSVVVVVVVVIVVNSLVSHVISHVLAMVSDAPGLVDRFMLRVYSL